MIPFFASILFLGGYFFIVLEHVFRIDKSAIALILGGALWLLVALTEPSASFASALTTVGADIFAIIVFLLASMTLVEILAHYEFFDIIRARLLRFGFSDRKEFWVLAVLTFCLSIVLNNLATTIVMLAIARSFFRGTNLLVMAVAIVISANASAFSPLGDVTTLMLWLSHKVSGSQLVLQLFLPTVALFFVSVWILSRRIREDTPNENVRDFTPPSFSERVVIAMALGSFLLPFLFSKFGLPAYLGITTGLAVVWIAADVFRVTVPRPSHLSADIERFLQRADISTLKFLIGVLLAVGALDHLGVLSSITRAAFGVDPAAGRLFWGSAVLGLFSAVVDNIPLTAAAIRSVAVNDQALWAFFALTVGTGGSLLAIGSSAGIVAMGSLRELTFWRYLRIGTLPAFVGYCAAIAVWLAQREIFP